MPGHRRRPIHGPHGGQGRADNLWQEHEGLELARTHTKTSFTKDMGQTVPSVRSCGTGISKWIHGFIGRALPKVTALTDVEQDYFRRDPRHFDVSDCGDG